MPEIVNEVPSDAELLAYLAESMASSGIAMLSEFPSGRIAWHPDVAEALAYLWAWPSRETFLQTAHDTLFGALKRLNQLSREDPFWRNTNRRPTIFKLPDFGEPDDALSLLTRAVLDLKFVTEFRPELWGRLYRLGLADLEFVAFAAMLLELAGAPDADEFEVFVMQTETAGLVRPLLREVAQNGGKFLGEWSGRVASVIGDNQQTPRD
jgi:hypothetical protein